MARIAGIISPVPREHQERLLERMLMASQSRQGWSRLVHAHDSVVLGAVHWRPPATYQGKDFIVVIDGTVYNRPELRASLEQNDAELIAVLVRLYGWAPTLKRLNGDFAIALYDVKGGDLFLARDRFGVKPLYFVSEAGRFAFASRPRALLALPGVSSAVNPQFVALFAGSHYRTFDNDSDRSPYEAIAQLPAAHFLHVSREGVKKVRYWALTDEPNWSDSENGLAERYRALLLDAVAIRQAAGRRLAYTLSGGMDSSSVLASAVHLSGEKQAAYSAVYDDKTFDESEEIRPMAQQCVSAWNPVRIGTPDILSLAEKMVEAHDEPVATATWLSHYLVCEAASQMGVGALFNGLGGDELNAGEYEYFFYFFADLKQEGREADLEEEITEWARYHDHLIYRKNRGIADETVARVADLRHAGRCLSDRRRLERYAAALRPDVFDLRVFEPLIDHPFRSYLKNRTYQDIFRETAPCCLRALDRQTTAFELETLTPFFDHRLVEFMFRVPGTLKIRRGVTKHLLRLAMRGILPEETRTRVKKIGWNAPSHIWFSGPGRAPLLDLVHSQAFRERGIYNVPEVLRLIDEHEAIVSSGRPEENHMMFLWQLVNLEIWLSSLKAARPAASLARG